MGDDRTTNYLRDVQYRTPVNLRARMNLHVLFSTNKYGWPRWLFDHFDLPEGAQILEVGCGPGTLWKSNAERVPESWRLTLTDFSAGMIEAAKETLKEGPPASFKVANAQHLSFEDQSFDAVMAHHMLYHVSDKKGALAEIRRVLKDGAVLFATTNGPRHLRQLWELIRKHAPKAKSTVPSEGFDLVNGPVQLAEVLEVLAVVEYPDSLEVTDPAPLIDYIRSMTTKEDVPDAELSSIEADLRGTIDTQGSFEIDKHAGVIKAIRADGIAR